MTPASATTSDIVVTNRVAGIKSALSGLVSDGTLVPVVTLARWA